MTSAMPMHPEAPRVRDPATMCLLSIQSNKDITCPTRTCKLQHRNGQGTVLNFRCFYRRVCKLQFSIYSCRIAGRNIDKHNFYLDRIQQTSASFARTRQFQQFLESAKMTDQFQFTSAYNRGPSLRLLPVD